MSFPPSLASGATTSTYVFRTVPSNGTQSPKKVLPSIDKLFHPGEWTIYCREISIKEEQLQEAHQRNQWLSHLLGNAQSLLGAKQQEYLQLALINVHLRARADQLISEIKELQENNQKTLDDLAQKEAMLEEVKQGTKKNERSIAKYQKTIAAERKNCDQLKGHQLLLERNISSLKEELTLLRQGYQKLQNEMETNQKTHLATQIALGQSNKRLSEAEGTIEEMKAKIARLEKDNQSLRKELQGVSVASMKGGLRSSHSQT
jgi:chromosome segregation ATPase